MKKIFTLISAVMLCLGANAQTQKLAEVIKGTMDTCKHEIVPVFLTKHVTYELDSKIDLGQKGVVIWGGEATVIVKGEGQITTQGYFQMRNANFDCSEATVAPFALAETPDASLLINAEGSAVSFPGANQQVYLNDHKVSIVKCNFRELKTSLIYANKAQWALNTLELDRNIVQLNGAKVDPVINWYGSQRGGIKHILLTDNLIYNVDQTNKDSYFIRFGNASNAQPQKIWGSNATCDVVMTSNTISFPGKHFGNNYPNTNKVVLDWKKNIFINTPYLNRLSGNAVRNFTPEDNILFFNNGAAPDATDLSRYGAEDKEAGIDIPTTALDFNNIAALAENFKPNFNSASTDKQFGAPLFVVNFKDGIAKTPGYGFQLVLGPDMLTTKTKEGKDKPAINDEAYPWIEYVNPTSTVDDGTAEVQQSNRWTDLDPATGEKGTFIQVTGKNGSVNSPVISKQWGKYLKLYVKNATRVDVYATGSAGGSAADGNGLLLTAVAPSGAKVEAQSAAGGIYGKGTASDMATLTLDENEKYEITINSLIEKDVMITGIRVYSSDTTPFPVCHAPEVKAPGTNYEVLLGPDMIITKKKDGNDKPGIDEKTYPWIVYTNPTSTLDDGTAEVQQSNRWTDLNPTTGEKGTFIQVTGKNGSVQSPVVSPAWGKNITFGVENTTLFTVYATGSAGGSAADGNGIKVTVVSNTGETAVYTSTPGGIYGKGTASDKLSVELDPTKAYAVNVDAIVAKDIMITGINLTGTDLTVAPAEENPGMGDVTGIENVETEEADADAPAYNVAGQRVSGSAKGLIIKGGKKYINR